MPDNTIPWVRLCCSCYQHTTEIVCDQDCLWIKVLPWNLHTEWLCLQALSSLSIHVGSISVYSNLLVYEQSVFEFLRRHLGTNCCSRCLFWADIGSQISNAQNTVTSHGGLCSSSSITVSFLSAFLWSFVLIIFNVYILRNSFLCIIFYGGFAPELYAFSTQF